MPLARSSRSPSASVCRRFGRLGFTLIELLSAIAVLAILGTITLGMLRGGKQRAATAKARGELAALTQALEAYKNHYGDYPQTGSLTQATPAVGAEITATQAQAVLVNALLGVYSPTDFATGRNGPMLVEMSKLRFEETRDYTTRVTTNTLAVPQGTPPAKPRVATSFLDPWGNRYLYYYKPAPMPGRPPTNQWRLAGYLLYSAGPDGQHVEPNRNTGLFTGTTGTTGVNADNILATP